MYSSISESMRK